MIVMILDWRCIMEQFPKICFNASDQDPEVFFIRNDRDVNQVVCEELNRRNVTIDYNAIIIQQMTYSHGATYAIRIPYSAMGHENTLDPVQLYSPPLLVGLFHELTDSLLLTNNLTELQKGIIYRYRVVLLSPEDIQPHLLMYTNDSVAAKKCVDKLKTNEFGVKVYFENNPYYDENASVEKIVENYSK